jgi:hypothetical protein
MYDFFIKIIFFLFISNCSAKSDTISLKGKYKNIKKNSTVMRKSSLFGIADNNKRTKVNARGDEPFDKKIGVGIKLPSNLKGSTANLNINSDYKDTNVFMQEMSSEQNDFSDEDIEQFLKELFSDEDFDEESLKDLFED